MDYKTIYTKDEIRHYIAGANVVAFDFETAPDDGWRGEPKAALDAHKAHIVGVSLSVSEGSAVYVPLAHKAGDNVSDRTNILECLREAVFENRSVVKAAHNLAFEAMFLYALGIVVCEPCYDTIAAAQLTLKSKFEFRKLSDSGLKLLAASLFGADMPDFSAVTAGRYFDELNPQDAETVRYACADSDYTLRLYHKFNGWFDRYLPKHRLIVEHIESPTAIYCGMMKYNGVPVDVEAMKQKQKEAETKLYALRAEIDEMTGGVDIGANASTSAFKQYLYKDLGLPVLKTTGKHQEAIDDAAMIMLAEYCKEKRPELVRLFELVQEYRKWGKLKSTYIDGYMIHINTATGKIHPDLMPLSTETGRFACRRPNLQNQIAPSTDPVGVRNFITAPDGWVLMEADYSQAEIRLVAYVSNDKVLLDAYKNGVDVHAITTSAVFGIPIEEAMDHTNPHYKHRRTVAKGTMFGIMYGITGAGLSRNLYTNAGISLTKEECDSYIKGILCKYTGMAAWQKSQKKLAGECMYVETAMGRRRYLPFIRSSNRQEKSYAERMAINTPVQGLGADCLKHSMALLIRELKGRDYIRPILTVHDSLVFLVREDHVDEAKGLVKKCMETPPPLPNFMSLVADVSVGKRYGDLE